MNEAFRVPELTDWLVRHLSKLRFDLASEKAVQGEMGMWLRNNIAHGIEVSREHRLDRGDIPDFLIGGAVAIEVKLRRTTAPVILRQLVRYAKHADVQAIILASNKAVRLPESIDSKPLFNVSLGRAWM